MRTCNLKLKFSRQKLFFPTKFFLSHKAVFIPQKKKFSPKLAFKNPCKILLEPFKIFVNAYIIPCVFILCIYVICTVALCILK